MASPRSQKKSTQVPNSASERETQDTAPLPTAGEETIFGFPPRQILFGILVLAALLRIVYLVSIQDNPDYNLPTADAAYKHFWARAILTGDATPPPGMPDPELNTSPYVRPPTYSFFLALVYLLTGTSFTALRILQMALGVASCWLLYRLARRAFSETVSLLGTFLMATYWIFIFFEGEMNSPPLIVFLMLAIMNLMMDWSETPTLKRVGWAGLCFGILVLDRPETLLFLPALLLWGYVAAPREGFPVSRRLLHLAVVPMVVALCIAPVTLRNYVKSGEPVLICTIGGLNLYVGNNPEATGYFPNLDYQKLFGVAQGLSHHNFPQLVKGLERTTGQTGLTQSDLEDYFVEQAVTFMKENPGKTLGLMLRKASYFWGPHEISSDKVFELEKRHSWFLRFLPPFWMFLPLAVVGLVLFIAGHRVPALRADTRPQAWRPVALMLAFVAISFGTHLLFFVVARFRVPIIPFVLLFAAFALVEGVRLLRRRDNFWLGVWGGVAVLATLVFCIPWAPYQADELLYRYQRALAYGHTGDTTSAIKELKLAVSAGGEQSPDITSELGFGLSLQGEVDNALYWYEKALAADPNHALTLRRKGDALLGRNSFVDAAEAYRRAVAASFTDVGARLGLVRALARTAQFEEAEKVASETIAMGLDAYAGHIMLAELASYRNQHEAALGHLLEAIELQPNAADTHNQLGLQYAALGRYDEAIASYRKAISLSPGYALAYTNLGNLYAHQGEYDKAIIQYTDALTADLFEPGAEYGWGFVNAQRGEMDKAKERMRLAIEKRPDYMEAHNYLGFLLLQEGNFTEARFHLERAVRLAPNFTAARNNLGDVYLGLGQTDRAREQYAAALVSAPNDPYAAAQLQKLAEQSVAPKVVEEGEKKVLVFP